MEQRSGLLSCSIWWLEQAPVGEATEQKNSACNRTEKQWQAYGASEEAGSW